MVGYSQMLAYMNEVKLNDREKITVRWKSLPIGQGVREPTIVGANKTKQEKLFKEKRFELRVELMGI